MMKHYFGSSKVKLGLVLGAAVLGIGLSSVTSNTVSAANYGWTQMHKAADGYYSTMVNDSTGSYSKVLLKVVNQNNGQTIYTHQFVEELDYNNLGDHYDKDTIPYGYQFVSVAGNASHVLKDSDAFIYDDQILIRPIFADETVVVYVKPTGQAIPTAPKPSANQTGVITVNYVKGYGIQVYHANGTNYNVKGGKNSSTVKYSGAAGAKKLQHGSAWKVYGTKTIKGMKMYSLGGDQYFQAKYTIFRGI
ncbi:hypothetical protein IV56_GL002217 [Lacticaseibacillus saniviri JCM 17471 = DSM 24301]|uniref:Surface layer protein A domain-containing protein n=2 Tax=Lacticaseibacillus saniviri TaxID=931533 RepID=A0A0R2N1W1_9LACO|nr:hypothetical protein [Lacticaseibacillus saniviri]KRO17731.1 hypothetical protein IV56_GL002217 [Lacticaseibacillus saniviri JCM 17471 = DSM 24301]